MSEENIEETNSGVKKKGNWKEISQFGEKLGDTVSSHVGQDSLDKFESWRPKIEESEKDVKKKTVEEAVIPENRLEKDAEGIPEDLKEASYKVAEAGKKAVNKESPQEEIFKASEDAAKPFYSKVASLFREIEAKVYSWFALRFNPYYLDTEDFSVDMKHRKNGEFEMDVSVSNKETREKVKEEFRPDNG